MCYETKTDFEFEMPDGSVYSADLEINRNTYLWGEDADGNRGEWRTDIEFEILEVRDEAGNPVRVTDEIYEIINDRLE